MGNANLQIYSLQGQLVYSENISGNGLKILDLSSLAKGIFMVRMQNDQFSLNKKLIIQ